PPVEEPGLGALVRVQRGPQMLSVPWQVCPVRTVVAVPTIVSVPAGLAVRRSTENEPLGARVVAVPWANAVPLRRSVQFQFWPLRFVSTSNSTSRRPSSGLAFRFQSAAPLQPPVRTTAV